MAHLQKRSAEGILSEERVRLGSSGVIFCMGVSLQNALDIFRSLDLGMSENSGHEVFPHFMV